MHRRREAGLGVLLVRWCRRRKGGGGGWTLDKHAGQAPSACSLTSRAYAIAAAAAAASFTAAVAHGASPFSSTAKMGVKMRRRDRTSPRPIVKCPLLLLMSPSKTTS